MPTELPDLDILIAELQTVPMVRNLDRASLVQLAQSAIRRAYATGVVIFLEGNAASALYG